MEKKNDGFLSFVLVIGALLLFAKTADVMSYFSPSILNDIIGFDVSLIYGIVTAGMVEGVILALHFIHRAANHAPAVWVKWLLLIISGVCQFYDGAIVTNTLAQQSDTLKIAFQFGVPLIPLLIVVMIIWIGALPETKSQRGEWKGIQHYFNQLPKIYYGAAYRPAPKTPNAPMQALGTDVKEQKVKEPDTVNPTHGSNGRNHP